MGTKVILSILGGGSWGTALAIVLAPRFEQIRLWVYETDLAQRICAARENDLYLPGFRLPDHIQVSSDLEAAVSGAGIVLSVMPSHLVRALYTGMLPLLDPAAIFVSATKGLENGTDLRMTEVIRNVVSARF